MNQESEAPAPEFDKDGLYQEETFTDRQVGTIRRMSPVTADGDRDEERPVLYMGATQIMTQAGPMPLNFDIPGESLSEAASNFGECAQKAVEELAERMEEMRREQASSIVVPGQGGPQGGSGIVGV